MKRSIVVIGLALLFLVSAISAEETKPKKEGDKKADTTTAAKKMDSTTAAKKPTDKKTEESKVPEWTTTESGLKYRDLAVGEGTEAKNGSAVVCHYTVWLSNPNAEKGKMIDNSREGDPTTFTLGPGLIKGWNEGMTGMKPGGRRELLVSPELGWGSKPYGTIPANSTVFFDIEYIGAPK